MTAEPPIPIDLPLELLCLLSPTRARCADLIKDLHLPSKPALRDLVSTLIARGYMVQGAGHGWLVLPARDMPKAERECARYLKAAHGE